MALVFHHSLQALVRRRYGTLRGLLRLLLAQLEWLSGRLRAFSPQRAGAAQRLVFVCQGNICRSAFADQLALQTQHPSAALPVASLGLSTCSGAVSPPAAQQAALRCGVDLERHRACDFSDFTVLPGDLFLVMEVRQARELRRRLGPRTDVEVVLLGLWCTGPMPHLHDPFTLSDAYFDQCFARVRQAVRGLQRAVPQLTRRQPADMAATANEVSAIRRGAGATGRGGSIA